MSLAEVKFFPETIPTVDEKLKLNRLIDLYLIEASSNRGEQFEVFDCTEKEFFIFKSSSLIEN